MEINRFLMVTIIHNHWPFWWSIWYIMGSAFLIYC